MSKYLFSKKNGKPYTVDYLSKKFKEAVRDLGLDDRLHLHSVRHSAATRWVQNGTNIFAVQKLLGHAQISTTQVYMHSNVEYLRKELGKKLVTSNE
jgi:integrase/recombinase XerD